MTRSNLRHGLAIGLACAGLAGCQSDYGSSVRKSKPEDPTAWTGTEITKEGSSSSQGLPKSSRLQGGLSSEAREIESSLGVGR